MGISKCDFKVNLWDHDCDQEGNVDSSTDRKKTYGIQSILGSFGSWSSTWSLPWSTCELSLVNVTLIGFQIPDLIRKAKLSLVNVTLIGSQIPDLIRKAKLSLVNVTLIGSQIPDLIRKAKLLLVNVTLIGSQIWRQLSLKCSGQRDTALVGSIRKKMLTCKVDGNGDHWSHSWKVKCARILTFHLHHNFRVPAIIQHR